MNILCTFHIFISGYATQCTVHVNVFKILFNYLLAGQFSIPLWIKLGYLHDIRE